MSGAEKIKFFALVDGDLRRVVGVMKLRNGNEDNDFRKSRIHCKTCKNLKEPKITRCKSTKDYKRMKS